MPGMKRFSTIIKRDKGSHGNGGSNGGNSSSSNGSGGFTFSRLHNKDSNSARESPEAIASRSVRLFCESASSTNAGEEVLHLPPIVDAAESSPAAAAAAADQIRKFLAKDHYHRPHVQYNAVMLLRILADNPGPSFTRNMDEKFKDNLKSLLRGSRDPSVQQITRETLDHFVLEKEYDENLKLVNAMWKKERGPMWQPRMQQNPGQFNTYGYGGPNNANAYTRYTSRSSHPPSPPVAPLPSPSHTLPPPEELAGRIEEARTSANLLMQLCSSTPAADLPFNELVSEFASRCQSAQQSLTGFMNATDPAPDEDTFQTLIETVEQLSLANSRHQRAVLAARREAGFVAGFSAPEAAIGVPSGGRRRSPAPPSPPPLPASFANTSAPVAAWAAPQIPSANVSTTKSSYPIPTAAMRSQLNVREENGAVPSVQALFPAASSPVPIRNPFEDDQQDAGSSHFAVQSVDEYAVADTRAHNMPFSSGTSPSRRQHPQPPYTGQRQSLLQLQPPGSSTGDSAYKRNPYDESTFPINQAAYDYKPNARNEKGKLPAGRPGLAPPPPPPPHSSRPLLPSTVTPRQHDDDESAVNEPPTPFASSFEPPTPMLSNPPQVSSYPAYTSPYYTVPASPAHDTRDTRAQEFPTAHSHLQEPSSDPSQRSEVTNDRLSQDPWSAQRRHWSTLSTTASSSGAAAVLSTINFDYPAAAQPQPQPQVPAPRPHYVELEAPASPPRPGRAAPPPPAPSALTRPQGGVETLAASDNSHPVQDGNFLPDDGRPSHAQFQSTPSYARQQDLAANQLVMSGADTSRDGTDTVATSSARQPKLESWDDAENWGRQGGGRAPVTTHSWEESTALR